MLITQCAVSRAGFHGTSVDATVIPAPSSTRNRTKERNSEMRQTKQGNHWHIGLAAQIEVDSQTKLIHSVATTSANMYDGQVLPKLLHGQETRVWGNAAYSGPREAIRHHAPAAHNFVQTKAPRHRPLSKVERARNRTKSKVCAKIKHAFLMITRIFVTCGSANLYVVRRYLLVGT
jgi:transposase, IS5 family